MSKFTQQTLVLLFNKTFIPLHNTELFCCEDEPIYRPADNSYPHHRIIFAHGFFASALHEIAHWCIAGKERRKLEDFGYWYQPDGRTQEVQNEFEKVEIKPQALEWVFSASIGFHFNFSSDNLDSDIGASTEFRLNIHQQIQHYLEHGLPSDAKIWSDTLIQHYRPNHQLKIEEFKLEN